jgi:hypothetical protein
MTNDALGKAAKRCTLFLFWCALRWWTTGFPLDFGHFDHFPEPTGQIRRQRPIEAGCEVGEQLKQAFKGWAIQVVRFDLLLGNNIGAGGYIINEGHVPADLARTDFRRSRDLNPGGSFHQNVNAVGFLTVMNENLTLGEIRTHGLIDDQGPIVGREIDQSPSC